MPHAAGAAPSGGLLLCDDNRTLRLAGFPEFHGDAIGGIDFEEMKDTLPEQTALEALVQQIRSDDVVNFFEKIPGARLALYFDVKRAQTLHPPPHSRT